MAVRRTSGICLVVISTFLCACQPCFSQEFGGRIDLLLQHLGRTAASTPVGGREILHQIQGINPVFASALLAAGNSSIPTNVSETCLNHTMLILEGLTSGQEWALAVLDATGKLPPGVLQGNFNWLGSYDQCVKISAELPVYKNGTQIGTDKAFGGKYCSASIPIPIKMPTATALTLGLCVPDSCDDADVTLLMDSLLSLLSSNYTSTVQCDTGPEKLSALAIATICLLSILGIFLVGGTLYDIVIYQPRIQPSDGIKSPQVNHDGAVTPSDRSDTLTATEYTPLLNPRVETKGADGQSTLLGRLSLSLSVLHNGCKILQTSPGANSTLGSLHGIRFFSMTWVMLGHAFVFSVSLVGNPLAFYDVLKRFTFQAIVNASVSVDSFFLLSGTLVAYLLLREMKQCGGPRHINWALFYFHRFWRLTPPYMLVLLTNLALFKYWGDGPLWMNIKGINDVCHKTWWTNLLYINNLVYPSEMCIAWSWYLANDMQFFVISPLFIVLLYKWQVVGMIVTGAGVLINIIVTAVITYENNYPAEFIGTVFNQPPQGNNTTTGMLGGNWFKDVYMAPWCRIGPYLIGILLGFILYKTERKVNMHWAFALLGWCLAAAINLSVLYGLYDIAHGQEMTSAVSAIYSSLHRPAWAVGLSWVIFACVTGHGGFVNTLLSWSAIVPLSRLTYMAYLIHPIVMYIFYFNKRTLIYFDDLTMIYFFLGHLAVSYGFAFVVSLAFEAPMMGLEKVIFPKRRRD